MNPTIQKVVYQILEKMFNEFGRKHDSYYEKGSGVLIVPQDYPCEPRYVIASVTEHQLQVMSLTGVNINFK